MQTMFIIAYNAIPRQSFLKNSDEEIDNISLLVYNSFVKGNDAVTVSLLFRCFGGSWTGTAQFLTKKR